jgi:hypothetical protein
MGSLVEELENRLHIDTSDSSSVGSSDTSINRHQLSIFITSSNQKEFLGNLVFTSFFFLANSSYLSLLIC